MNENTRDEIDDALAGAFSDVHASDELKAATMARIAEMRACQQAEQAHETPRGNVIEMGPGRGRRKRIFAIAASIAFCLVLASGTANVLINTETTFAEVSSPSINAPVTLSVNRFDNVIGIKTDNPNLQSSVDALALKGMNYEDAVQTLVNSGCLGEESIDITIGGNNSGQKDKMVSGTMNCLENSGHSGECNGKGFGAGSGSGSGNGNGSGTAAGTGQGNGAHHNGHAN